MGEEETFTKLFSKLTTICLEDTSKYQLEIFRRTLKNMVRKELGLTGRLNPGKPTLGFTDAETMMLDFDKTKFKNVKFWSLKTLKWFKLGGFLVLESTLDSYHVRARKITVNLSMMGNNIDE